MGCPQQILLSQFREPLRKGGKECKTQKGFRTSGKSSGSTKQGSQDLTKAYEANPEPTWVSISSLHTFLTFNLVDLWDTEVCE